MISNTDSTLLVYLPEHMLVKVYKGREYRQRFQSACGDAPSDAFLAGAIQSAARSGRFSVEAGTRAAAPFPCTPFSASGILPPLCSGQVSLDEAEHFPAQSRSQRRYTPMVFGIIPECRSASFGTGVQLRRNPQASDYFFVRQSINRCSCGSAAQGYSPGFPAFESLGGHKRTGEHHQASRAPQDAVCITDFKFLLHSAKFIRPSDKWRVTFMCRSLQRKG
jgi:hypothetical protein